MSNKKKRKSRKKQNPDFFKNLFLLLFNGLFIFGVFWFVYQGSNSSTQQKNFSQSSKLDVKIKSETVNRHRPKQKAVQQVQPVVQSKPKVRTVQKQNDSFVRYDRPQYPVKKVEPVQKPIIREVPVSRPTGPKIVFVIDDMGNTDDYKNYLGLLRNKVTYAILPHLSYTKTFVDIARQTGAEVILHLPMEAKSGKNPGPGTIQTTMTDAQIINSVRENLQSVSYLTGVNNHMGSKATEDSRVMNLILNELKSRNLFFLDSHTTKDSIAYSTAKRMNMPALKRDTFLDNVDEQGEIRKQINLLIDQAVEQGQAIGIGHYRYNTLKVLSEVIPELEKNGFRVVNLKDLL